MLTINTNLSSLIVQSNLNQSTNALNRAIERMTTGFKINSAKDNAANYGISTQMSTKISAYEVAEDNVATGLDLLTTASDSLSLISDHLARIRALTEQASNGTYGEESMKAINAEINARVDEIERLYLTTEFNGINLFTGIEVNSVDSAFISDVERRDTTNMTALQSIDGDKYLDGGTYSISSAEELAKLAEMTNNGLIGAGTEFVLANDIDLSSYSNWTPIGNANISGDLTIEVEDLNPFKGVFDGNGYTISNLTISASTGGIQGLFGNASGARIVNTAISNLSLSDADSSASGALIGRAVGCYISNCYSTNGNIEGCTRIGGLTGIIRETIMENCYSDCNVSGSNYYVGGLIGVESVSSRVSNSFATGDVFCGKRYGGGVAGMVVDESVITGCYSTSKVSGYKFIAGITGSMRMSKLDNCYYKGDISGIQYSSGIVGYVVSSAEIGCLISNCSTLTESDSITSVLVGWVEGDGSILDIENCHYSKSYDTSHKQLYQKSIYSTFSIYDISPCEVTDIPFIIENSSKTKTYNTSSEMQVGINSNDSSRIGINTGCALIGIEVLRNIGSYYKYNYVETLDAILKQVWNKQTELGAAQNRLESALEEINTHYENLVSSRSTLRDADVAEESSAYIRNQILQQASATLLATTNQTPAIALQLL